MVGFRPTKIVKVRFFVVDSIKFRNFAAKLASGSWPLAFGSFLIDVRFTFFQLKLPVAKSLWPAAS
jgi:hypothetical protein